MNKYPIILIPTPILQALDAVPMVWKFTEPKPIAPNNKPQPINLISFFSKAIPLIITFASISVIAKSIILTLHISIGGILIAAFNLWRQQNHYLLKLNKYEQEVRDYNRQLAGWRERELQHKREMAESQKPEKLKQYRYQIIKDILLKTVPADGRSSSINSQWLESEFYNQLQQLFPKKIYNNLSIQNPTSYQPYCIEIAYFNKLINLHITIEVDMPFYDDTGKPSNQEVLVKENQRHQILLQKGWIVIRFAEEQVVSSPQSCCKVIAEVIDQVVGTQIPEQLKGVENLQPLEQ
ncbi:endonuclease domain-containing protein [Argonema antarcticum]|uniref:endonuclease domain-containing protein n=1 Tax=Argonema antarcticum TaxID=2942763 RepID=UPI0020123589|nr:endonuclease domain-containing protein [Argonema antarcticum]